MIFPWFFVNSKENSMIFLPFLHVFPRLNVWAGFAWSSQEIGSRHGERTQRRSHEVTKSIFKRQGKGIFEACLRLFKASKFSQWFFWSVSCFSIFLVFFLFFFHTSVDISFRFSRQIWNIQNEQGSCAGLCWNPHKTWSRFLCRKYFDPLHLKNASEAFIQHCTGYISSYDTSRVGSEHVLSWSSWVNTENLPRCDDFPSWFPCFLGHRPRFGRKARQLAWLEMFVVGLRATCNLYAAPGRLQRRLDDEAGRGAEWKSCSEGWPSWATRLAFEPRLGLA